MTAGYLASLRGLFRGDGLRAQLLRGGAGSALIQASNRLLALLLGIVLARSLGAEGYGTYAYAFAVMGLLTVVAEAGVPTLLMREVSAGQGRNEWGLLRGAVKRAGQFVLAASMTVALAGLAVLWVTADRLNPATVQTTGLMLAVLPLAALVQTVAHAIRGLHRVVAGQAVAMLLRPLIVLLLVGAGFYFFPELRRPQYAMAAQVVAAALVLVFGRAMLCRFLPVSARAAEPVYRSRVWLRSLAPFTLLGGAAVINHHADLIMLGWFRPAADVGLYRVAVQGAVLVTFGLQAANAVVAPQIARLHARGEMERLEQLVVTSARVVLLVALPIALSFILAGGAIVDWVFGAGFTASHVALAILSGGQLLNAAFGSVGFLLSMTGHENDAARTLLQTAALNIVLNAVLIPLYGMEGAAVASALSLVTWNWLRFRLVGRRLGIRSTAFRLGRVFS